MLIRRAFRVWAVALGAVACAPSADAPPDAPPERRDEPPLWIGMLRRDLHLVPIARYDGGRSASAEDEGWDEPWPQRFRFEDLRFDRDRGTPAIFPEFGMAPGADTAESGGSAPHDWTRNTEAPVDWHFHVRGRGVSTLATSHLSLMRGVCLWGWGLPVEETPDLEAWLHQTATRRDAPAAVTFSRAPDAVLTEAEIPTLDEVRRELNLVDRPEPGRPPDDNAATFRWLGFYRFDDLLLGVVHERGYEYQSLGVVRLDGDRGRIVATRSIGGC